MDVFRVFDSLNYIKNLNLGVDAANISSVFVEVTLSYTGYDYILDGILEAILLGGGSSAALGCLR